MSPALYAIQLCTETDQGRRPVVGADFVSCGTTAYQALENAISDRKFSEYSGSFTAEVTNLSHKATFYIEVTIQ